MIKQLQAQIAAARELMNYVLGFEANDFDNWIRDGNGVPCGISEKAWDVLSRKYEEFMNNDKFFYAFAAKTEGHMFCAAARLKKLLNEKPKDLTIHIPICYHRHGEDMDAFLTSEEADAWELQWVKDHRYEHNEYGDIPDDLSDEEVWDQWSEFTGHQERFDCLIFKVEVPDV